MLACIAVVFVAGCSTKKIQLADDGGTVAFKPVKSITGVIEMWIATPHPGEPRLDFAVCAIDLNHGKITPCNSQEPHGELSSGASIYHCQGKFQSPDKKFEFSCKSVSGRENDTPVSLRIVRAGGEEALAAQLEEGLRVTAIDWSPDSSTVAIVAEEEKYGKGPGDIFSAFFGHPVPYKSFGLRVYSLNSSAQLSIPTIVKNIPYAQADVHWKSSGGDVLEP